MQSSSDSSLRLVRRDRLQSLKHKPKTEDQFEQGHRRIENVVVNDFVEHGKDQEDESAEHAPGGRDYAKNNQPLGNIVRLKPQPRTNRGRQSKERQAHIVIIETGAEMQAHHSL